MLRAHKRILLSVPHMGGTEFRYVQEAFDTNWLSTVGPNLTELEKAFQSLVGRPAVALSSGTSGLHLALRASGIRPGDEVVTQSLTFVASTNPILQEHARPILIDSDRATWNIDPELLSDFLSRRARENRLPKAVMVVHLFGQPASIDDLLSICAQYEISLIEDAAESLGSMYRGQHPGTFGHIGVYSFNGNKMITGTTGGMLVTQDPALAARIRHWSTQARDTDPSGINNYIHTEPGYNYRMSNVIAGIVRGQLEVMPQRVCQRRTIFERYRQALADIPGIEPQPDLPSATDGPESGRIPEGATFHSRWLSCFVVDESRFGMSAPDLIRYLEQANVESRPVWRPMHVQPLFASAERIGGQVAEDLNRRGICLPSSSSLSDADHQFVVDVIRSAYRPQVAGR
jgi:pyridoxal phosphate-dependent aminotransferase EpsN